jgi:glycosyltransferase involved in cell wall biosynthesis
MQAAQTRRSTFPRYKIRIVRFTTISPAALATDCQPEKVIRPERKQWLSMKAVEDECAARVKPWKRPKAGGRLKLVLLIRSLTVGGAERQLVSLAKALDKKMFDITVVCLYGGGAFEEDLRTAGVPVISLGKKGRWEIFGFLKRLTAELRKLQPDILHSYMTFQNILAVLLKPALPATRIVWGVRASNVPRRAWLDKLSFRVEAMLSRFADLIVFNSAAGRDYHLSAGFAASRTEVIPNGVDPRFFAFEPESRSILRAAWKIPDDSFVIGVVGRLNPMKDHWTFLRAAIIFAGRRPDARFVCIGNGPAKYLHDLRSFADQLALTDKVVWHPFLDDMPSAYKALDICCSSSAYGEGTPNCVIEAMACGVPCVVTDVGDSRLIVNDLGIVVPPKNPEALADAWTTMARQITDKPYLRGLVQESVASRFSVSSLATKTTHALLYAL